MEFLAVFCAAVFSGAAIYISLVEHPARMSLDTRSAAAQWAPSYARATRMQAPLAILGFVAGCAAWFLGGGRAWLIAAVLIGLVVPFTLIVIKATNDELLASGRDLASADTRALLERWGTLHAVRSVLSVRSRRMPGGAQMRTRRALVAAAIVTLFATAIANAQPTPDAKRKIDEFAAAAGEIVHGKSLQQIEGIAPLRSHTVAPFAAPNAPPGESWETHSFRYDGLSLVGVVGPAHQFMLTKMVVTGPSFKLPQGLAVGASRKDVEGILGATSPPDSPRMTYEGETEKVTFHVADGHVTKVELSFYVD
jgi:hypothetical protein